MLKVPPSLRGFIKAAVAWPYRARFGSLGQSVRIMPPLLLFNPARARIGSRTIIEQYVGFSATTGSIEVGEDCELRCFSRLEAHSGSIRLGHRTSVNPFTLLSGLGGLTIGSDVRIGSHCQILSSTHLFDDPDRTIREQGVMPARTTIEDDVWIGSGCTVVGGLTIGRSSIVGAGAVVTRDVAPGSVVAGVPARTIAMRTAG